ncbi:MAG: hypothetical protein JO352_22360 [Chloroflexi bacterium]|nr:hypothetical protein [Chloroflexota bacterium]MBV9596387.1 hypothetical protein [Chloroflexota bacterium]
MGSLLLLFECAACGGRAQGNPQLVMSIPARWHRTQYVADGGGNREPICESCARWLLDRFQREGLPIPKVVGRSDYFERAYRGSADKEDI